MLKVVTTSNCVFSMGWPVRSIGDKVDLPKEPGGRSELTIDTYFSCVIEAYRCSWCFNLRGIFQVLSSARIWGGFEFFKINVLWT